MAEAMCRGILKSGLCGRESVLAADLSEERRGLFQGQLGVRAVADACEVARSAEVVVLAVKPQQMDAVLGQVGGLFGSGQLIVSIAAGLPTKRIEAACPPGARVVRVMPNTPMLVGKGMAAACSGAAATPEDVETALSLCRAAGDAVAVEEKDMDAVTAVSGSGPAYFFWLVERMAEAGVAEGLAPKVAARLAKQTALGAAELMLRSDASPEELRRRVTSPNGTTEAAMEVLAERGAAEAWTAAIRRAAERSRELACG